KIITITHKNANLKDIGRFVISDSGGVSVPEQLQFLKDELSITGLLYLPTCNRVMFFFYHEGEMNADFLRNFANILYPDWGGACISEIFLLHEGDAAIRHIFEVAASVDSLVVGEREIIRQLREAYTWCLGKKLTDDNIRIALDMTVKTAKEVYNRTRIGEKPVSVVSLAIKELLSTNVAPDSRVLLVGAGQTNALVCKLLAKYGFSNLTIFNRTLAKAQELADCHKGEAYLLADLATYAKGFDVMVVCTAATEAIICKENYTFLLQGDSDTKHIIDLAIPNNVDKSILPDFDMNYVEIEDLKKMAKQNLLFRSKEVVKAQEIIGKSICEFNGRYKERQLERAFCEMPIQIKAVKHKAVNEVFRKEMDGLDDETKELMFRMMTYMEKKCISIPMKTVKQALLKDKM
ncbi:MAG: glutamyl-tRNA reductase, partial [Saprospiraceae bacterium]